MEINNTNSVGHPTRNKQIEKMFMCEPSGGVLMEKLVRNVFSNCEV